MPHERHRLGLSRHDSVVPVDEQNRFSIHRERGGGWRVVLEQRKENPFSVANRFVWTKAGEYFGSDTDELRHWLQEKGYFEITLSKLLNRLSEMNKAKGGERFRV